MKRCETVEKSPEGNGRATLVGDNGVTLPPGGGD